LDKAQDTKNPARPSSFWRKYLRPSLKAAHSAVWAMDGVTRAQIWGAWLGTFIATEVITSLATQTYSDEQTRRIVTMVGEAALGWVLGYYVYLLAPRRALEKQRGRALPSTANLLSHHGKDLLSELLLVAASVLLWSLLGILPGIFKALRWGFVPYVVLTDERYFRGELNAKAESNSLIQGITWPILFIWLGYAALSLCVGLPKSAGDDWAPAVLGFAWRFGLSLASLYVLLYSVFLDFSLYRLRLEEKK
jgi:hypothetical protein